MMKKIYALLCLALIAGCAAKSADASPQTLSPSPDKGLAVGTITFEGDVPVNDIYRFFYNATSGDKAFKKANAGKIMIKGRNNNVSSFNGDFNNKKSYLFVIEREPGAYAFTQYSYLDYLGPTGSVDSSKEFAIPFEIKKGGITYLGELNYVDKAVKGSPRIFVADYFSRDLEEFRKKYPTLDWQKTENQTPKSGNTGDGIIDFRY